MRNATIITLLLAAACGSTSPNPTPPGPPQPSQAPCVKGGCSGTVCEEEGAGTITTCEMRPEYACYRDATCERQPDGACGWTPTEALSACLASPPPLE